jgi:ABC-type antimicrobial peptide transport system permease subunit
VVLAGVSSLFSWSFRRRQQELGIRIALGASPGSIWLPALKDGLKVVAIGLAAGTPAAVAAVSATRAFHYGIGTFDPLVWAWAMVLVLVAVVVSALRPISAIRRLSVSALISED